MHDTATNYSRITIKTAGKYIVGENFGWDVTAFDFQIGIRLNGGTFIAEETD